MSKTSKGDIIHRLSLTLIFLSEPHTVLELSQVLKITPIATYVYVRSMKRAGYPIQWQMRDMPGTGQNPKEYWIAYDDPVKREVLRLIMELRGM